MIRCSGCSAQIQDKETLYGVAFYPLCPECHEESLALGRPIFPLSDQLWIDLFRGVATLVSIEDRAGGRVWKVQARIDGLGTPRARLEVWVQGVQDGVLGKARRRSGRGA